MLNLMALPSVRVPAQRLPRSKAENEGWHHRNPALGGPTSGVTGGSTARPLREVRRSILIVSGEDNGKMSSANDEVSHHADFWAAYRAPPLW